MLSTLGDVSRVRLADPFSKREIGLLDPVLKTSLRTVRPRIRTLVLFLAIATLLAWTIGYVAGLIVIWFNS